MIGQSHTERERRQGTGLTSSHPFTPSPAHPLSRTRELLDLLPLYGAALAVTLCGIAAVNVTADYPNGSSLIVLLTVLGFGVSLAMRLLRVDPNQAMYPLIGFVLFVTLQRLLSGEVLIDMMIAMLGLTGSSNTDTEIVIYFFLFLLATIFMVGYEHHLRLQEESARAPSPS